MGGTQNYVKGGGSHTHVPVALNSKVELYRSSKKLNPSTTSIPDKSSFDPKHHKKIEWDIFPINE